MLYESDFLALLEEKHGIKLKKEDLRALDSFHFYLNRHRQSQLADDPDAVFYDIADGKVLGILAFATIGFFAAPLLGVGGIVGALMGAAIGWRLFGGKRQEEQEQKENKSIQSHGFDGLAALPAIGGAMPLIYCNRTINPNGGIRISGSTVHTRVETSANSQKLYQLNVFGYRQIGSVDVSSTLINDQPIDNFLQGEIIQYILAGTATQQSLPDFNFYSQSISPNSNNNIGSDAKAQVEGRVNNAIDLENAKETLDLFNASGRYRVRNQDFRVIAKDIANGLLYTNPVVNTVSDDWISEIWDFTYTTTKKVNQLDVHINGVFWASYQNDDQQPPEDVRQAGVWDFYITPKPSGVQTFVCRFGIRSRSKGNLRRVIKLVNVPYSKYKLEFRTVDWSRAEAENNFIAHLLDDSGNFIPYQFGSYIIIMEGGGLYDIRDAIDPTDKLQWGQQGSAPANVTSINEIVYPASLGQPKVVSYPEQSGGAIVANASNQLQGSPNTKWLITQGSVDMRAYVWAGTCTQADSTTLIDTRRGIGGTIVGNTLRNLDKGIEATVTAINSGQLTTSTPLYWSKNDRWVSFTTGTASNYFPDIYVDTLINKKGGLGEFINGDYFVDYESIVDSKAFCVVNNYFWDGIIDKSIAWAQWATQASMGSLLFPSRLNGKFALLREEQREPVALFNASNIIKGSFTEEFAEKQELNTLIIVYKDGSDASFKETSVTIQTDNAFNGFEQTIEETVTLNEVTNKAQAISFGKIFLKSRREQDRAIDFKTGLQGFYLQPGDFVLVQHKITEFGKERSGFALESTAKADGGTTYYEVLLSVDIELGIDPTRYNTACFHLENGIVENNLLSYSVQTTDGIKLYIYGLNYPILPPGDNRTGDYISIGENQTETRTYKVKTVDPQEDGTIGITAVLWTADILSDSGLVVVY